MMRTFTAILSIALLAALATCFLPWWMIAVVAFIISVFLRLGPLRAFFLSFVAIILFWLVAILFRDIPNQHILSARLAKLFSLPHYSLFIAVNLLIGGILGGLGGWAGGWMNRAFRK